ncbi:MAG TPA: universal stress protein [Methanocella sp.]|jgi:nucleotide-binding universal stress UspA family protein
MSHSIKKILIATDGSSRSRKAAAFGIDLAKGLGADALAVFVVDQISACSLEECITVRTPVQTAKDILVNRGEKATVFVENLGKTAGVEVTHLIVEGNAADQIIKTACEQSADLIVMGTLGTSGVKRFLIGSVAEKVIRHSPIPVVTVKK